VSSTVVIVVGLDQAVAPPASDSVHQLLALIDGLPTDNGDLDWRLISVSVNSPLRAELRAFTRGGEEVSEARLVAASHHGFDVLGAVIDNADPQTLVRRLSDPERRRLKSLLAPMRERTGRVLVSVPGRFEHTVIADRAQAVLQEIGRTPKSRPPELGSVEGQILSATTHYGSPAVRVRRFLSEEEVLCVFEKGAEMDIGARHTLAEVWTGRRVVVSGMLTFDGSGRVVQVKAAALKTFAPSAEAVALVKDAQALCMSAPDPAAWDGDG
jgi:hypothetical protein